MLTDRSAISIANLETGHRQGLRRLERVLAPDEIGAA
jgi:hypothetical protein